MVSSSPLEGELTGSSCPSVTGDELGRGFYVLHFMLYCFAQVTELLKSGKYFLHNEEVRLGFEHAVSIDELSEAYPLLDVIDHAKSRAAVCTLQGVLKILTDVFKLL